MTPPAFPPELQIPMSAGFSKMVTWYILTYYVHEYVTKTTVTRNGSENKLTWHMPQANWKLPQNFIWGPKRKRTISEEKQAISEKLENPNQLIALLGAHHLNLWHPDQEVSCKQRWTWKEQGNHQGKGERKNPREKPGSCTVGAGWARSHFKITPLFTQYIFIEPLPSARLPRHTEGTVRNRLARCLHWRGLHS